MSDQRATGPDVVVVGVDPVLAVHDLDRAAEWFGAVLGCSRLDVDPGNWVLCTAGPVRFLLGRCPDAVPAHDIGDHSYLARIRVSDVDAIEAVHARALDVGAEVLQPPLEQPWGVTDMVVRTPDGHRFTIST